MGEKIFIRKHRGGGDGGFPWIVSCGEPCYDNESDQYYADDRNDAFVDLDYALKYVDMYVGD